MAEDKQTDLDALARRARQMQGELGQVRDDLTALRATGYGAGGLVAATLSGEGRIVDLRIDPSAMDPDDPETLAATIIEAVDDAHRTLSGQRAVHLAAVTRGVDGLLAGLRGTVDGAGGGVVPRFPDRPPRPGDPRQGPQ